MPSLLDEQLLHYIWKFQKFDRSDLRTASGESLTIFHPGFHNHDAGPDFSNVRLRLGEVEWAGHVEIHTIASDWVRHRHHRDPAYDNVVLHVVHEADQQIHRPDGTEIPTLCLKERISPTLVDRHRALTHTIANIPCDSQISTIEPLAISSMIERGVLERLQAKSNLVKEILSMTQGDWEQATYVLLATALGMKTNAASFRDLALCLKADVLRKYNSNGMQIEALIFGAGGFLDYEAVDDYQHTLQTEFQFLFHKHRLPHKLTKSQWKFARLRPANFPTVRLAQLSSILSHHPALFTQLIKAGSFQEVTDLLTPEPSAYWQKHYDFGKPTQKRIGPPGKTAIGSIIINAIVPLLFAYGKQIADQRLVDKALDWLMAVPAENNKVTRQWMALSVRNESSFDSQGLLQLTKSYCNERRCLDCTIGNRILGS